MDFVAAVQGLVVGDPMDDATDVGPVINRAALEKIHSYTRIGRDFDPSLGFVPRRAVHLISGQTDNRTRPAGGPIQELYHQVSPSLALDLSGEWESYRVFFAPVNWQFRSGDRFEFNANPTGERLVTPFEIARGVFVPVGGHTFDSVQANYNPGPQHRVSGTYSLEVGSFYTGRKTTAAARGRFEVSTRLTFEPNISLNWVDLPEGSDVPWHRVVRAGRAQPSAFNGCSPGERSPGVASASALPRASRAEGKKRCAGRAGHDLHLPHASGSAAGRPGQLPEVRHGAGAGDAERA